MNIIEKNNVIETAEIAKIDASEILTPAKNKPLTIRISGEKVEVSVIEKKFNDVNCEIGRLKTVAEELRLGKTVKSMGGKLTRVVTSSAAKELHHLGRICPDDGGKSKRICREIKAMEMIAEAFEILGLAKREIL